MTAKAIFGQRTRSRDDNAAFSLSQMLGLGKLEHDPLNEAFYGGLRPILDGLKDGTLTEKQASLLIELLAAAYVGAKVNQQLDTTLQTWAEQVMAGYQVK